VFLRKTLAPAAAGMMFVAAAFALVSPAPVAAQEVVLDEGAFYRAWHEASQAGDNAKAVAAARTYLEKYPTGQYADFIKKWLPPYEYDLAIKEKRTADAITVGRQLLAGDPENLRLLYQLAFVIRANELLASPPRFDHAADAVEFSKKAIGQIEAGKTLEGAASFDKNAALAWLTQILAINEARNGTPAEAIKLYEQSTALAPADPQIAFRNLLAIVNLRQAKYGDLVKAYNALPEADRTAAEPTPEVKAARDALNAEADALIDAAAGFVAFGKTKNLSPAMVDRVNQTLQTIYKNRFPEDATLEGLTKILAAKGVPAP
jgi:tetratricopeptide (TPR) repeat protein